MCKSVQTSDLKSADGDPVGAHVANCNCLLLLVVMQ